MDAYSAQQIRAMAASNAATMYAGKPNLPPLKDLVTEIATYIAEGEGPFKPHLGVATTQQLMEELATRMEVTQNSLAGRELGMRCREAVRELDAGILNYRTTNG